MNVPKGGAADWTQEGESEERAIERRGKLGGSKPPGGAKQTPWDEESVEIARARARTGVEPMLAIPILASATCPFERRATAATPTIAHAWAVRWNFS